MRSAAMLLLSAQSLLTLALLNIPRLTPRPTRLIAYPQLKTQFTFDLLLKKPHPKYFSKPCHKTKKDRPQIEIFV